MTRAPLNIAVAVSGSGRSLRNFLAEQNSKSFRVCAVIASRSDCIAADHARSINLPLWIDSFPREMSAQKQEELVTWLLQHKVDLIVLGGFLRPFPILKNFSNKIINIHPALLPSHGGQGMYGIKVHQAVIASGETYSGATVHFVTQEYDKGQIIAQIRVSIEDLKDPQEVADRVFSAECKLYPQVVHQMAEGTLPDPTQTHPIFEVQDL